MSTERHMKRQGKIRFPHKRKKKKLEVYTTATQIPMAINIAVNTSSDASEEWLSYLQCSSAYSC